MTGVEQGIEQIEEEDVDLENIVKEKTPNESKNSARIQWKQKFKTLDDILNDNNYDNAPPQAEHSFKYTDSKKKKKWNGQQINTNKSIKQELECVQK